MKLYTLTMEGIGPFAQRVDIDFRAFDDSGVFLLRGPTGSGKTTILDAIVFALYGGVSHDGKKSEARLRSHYIDDRRRAYVELVFGTQSGIYRVVREPAYTKAGNKKQTNAKATLTQVVPRPDGTFAFEREISFGPRQVNPVVNELIGLNREQFLQTIILPQGQFAKFLSAPSQERQTILQSIFGTQRFEDYQKRLLAQAKNALHRIATHQENIKRSYDFASHSFQSVREHSSETLLVGAQNIQLPLFPERDLFEGEAPDLVAALHTYEEFLDTSLNAANDALRSKRESYESAQRGLSLLRERQQLETTLSALRTQAESISAKHERVTCAQRVAPLVQPYEQLKRSWLQLHKSHTTVSKHLCEGLAHSCMSTDSSHLDEIEADIRRSHLHVIEEKAMLKPLVDQEKNLSADESQLTTLQSELDKDRNIVKGLHEERKSLPDKLKKLTENITHHTVRAQQRKTHIAAVAELKTRLTAAKEAQKHSEAIASFTQSISDTSAKAHKAHADAEKLRNAWLKDSAVSLATELRDGQACLVCGAVEHPRPAQANAESKVVSRQEVEAAQALSTQADRELAEEKEKLFIAQSELSRLEAHAQGSVEQLRESLEQAQTLLAQSESSAQEADKLRTQHDKLEARRNTLDQEISDLEQKIATHTRTCEVLEQTISQIRTRLEYAKGQSATVAERMDVVIQKEIFLDSFLEELNTVRACIAQWALSTQHFSDALATLEDMPKGLSWQEDLWLNLGSAQPYPVLSHALLTELLGANIADKVHELLSQVLPSSEIDTLNATIARHHESVALTEERLAEDKFIALSGEEEGVADAAHAELESQESLYSATVTQISTARGLIGTCRHALETLTQNIAQLQAAEAGSAALIRLAQLANGDPQANNAGIPLASWVLVSLFQDVLNAANTHLRIISGGRYALELQSGDDKRMKHGLELLLVDYDADEVHRYPETLSGGETFYVSLSLALGLSEIVTGENGGIHMKSMFIDEGFGSLDPHTLDTVMDVLHQLRQEDRLIGIISHVEELSKRISEQIVITKHDGTGSQLSVRA